MAERADEFMRESDAFSWYLGNDPALRATIVTVAWLDQAPNWEILLDRIERFSRLVPIFRLHPVDPPGRLATPRWTPDPDFDLSRHLHRLRCPAPHTPETVLDFARVAAMTAFDTDHPLWELTLFEDLSDGAAAMVMKLHHSLTDGLGGMQLLLVLFDTDAGTPLSGPLPYPPTGTVPGIAELVARSVRHRSKEILGIARRLAVRSLPAASRNGRHPIRSWRDAIETFRSVGRVVAPVSNTLSPVMTARGLGRRFATLQVGLDELKQASAVAGGSLNDGFLASVTGGLRRYHERHGAPVHELRITLPISVRTPDDPALGNRMTLARFTVPVDVADPAVRIRTIGRLCRAARKERSLPHADAIAGTLNLLPSGVVGSMLKHVDFVASNVMGPQFPVYLAGARVTGYIPFSPTIGAAVNITLLSYNGTCGVGVTFDTLAIPDTTMFMSCLTEGFAEVLALTESRSESDATRLPNANEEGRRPLARA
jgi:WS/DGAT/MGAT family acyltransferase